MPTCLYPRRWPRRAAAVFAVACAAVLAGCTTHPPAPISATAIDATAHSFKEYTVYWAGREIDGVRLTDADSPAFFYSPVGFTMYYGDCEGRGILHDGGCTFPLKITTSIYSAHSDASFGPQRWITLHGVPAVVYHGGNDIEIYTDRMDIDIVGDSPARALAAAKALAPFNRVPSTAWPAFPQPEYTPNPPATGVTGETTAIAPPPQLEPSPEPSAALPAGQ